MRTETIENYLKSIYNLSSGNTQLVSNQRLAEKLEINPASVTEALRKLHELKYVIYEKSYGTRLTGSGCKLALTIVRRHRIWETFLARELGFGWEEVHAIAEELEHVQNDKLINRLAERLGHPSFDPHGDPIPDARGKFTKSNFIKLSEGTQGSTYTIMGVTDHSPAFLKYLERHSLLLGKTIKVRTIEEFDGSFILSAGNRDTAVSRKVAEHMIVQAVE